MLSTWPIRVKLSVGLGLLVLVVAILCDVLDGTIARLLGATSDFGQEMDSFSDAISFGVAPAFLVYLAVLYAIIPLLLNGFDLDQTVLFSFFVPQAGGGLIASAWPVALEVIFVAVLMGIRWKKVRQPLAVDTA